MVNGRVSSASVTSGHEEERTEEAGRFWRGRKKARSGIKQAAKRCYRGDVASCLDGLWFLDAEYYRTVYRGG